MTFPGMTGYSSDNSTLTMGYPTDILAHHKLFNLIEKGKFALTPQRVHHYYRLLEYPDVTIKTCKISANTMPLLTDGTEHECVAEVNMLDYVPICSLHILTIQNTLC